MTAPRRRPGHVLLAVSLASFSVAAAVAAPRPAPLSPSRTRDALQRETRVGGFSGASSRIRGTGPNFREDDLDYRRSVAASRRRFPAEDDDIDEDPDFDEFDDPVDDDEDIHSTVTPTTSTTRVTRPVRSTKSSSSSTSQSPSPSPAASTSDKATEKTSGGGSTTSVSTQNGSEDSSGSSSALGVGLGVGLGLAALIMAVLAFACFILPARRKRAAAGGSDGDIDPAVAAYVAAAESARPQTLALPPGEGGASGAPPESPRSPTGGTSGPGNVAIAAARGGGHVDYATPISMSSIEFHPDPPLLVSGESTAEGASVSSPDDAAALPSEVPRQSSNDYVESETRDSKALLLEVDNISENPERFEDVLTASCNSAAPGNVPGANIWTSTDERTFADDVI